MSKSELLAEKRKAIIEATTKTVSAIYSAYNWGVYMPADQAGITKASKAAEELISSVSAKYEELWEAQKPS